MVTLVAFVLLLRRRRQRTKATITRNGDNSGRGAQPVTQNDVFSTRMGGVGDARTESNTNSSRPNAPPADAQHQSGRPPAVYNSPAQLQSHEPVDSPHVLPSRYPASRVYSSMETSNYGEADSRTGSHFYATPSDGLEAPASAQATYSVPPSSLHSVRVHVDTDNYVSPTDGVCVNSDGYDVPVPTRRFQPKCGALPSPSTASESTAYSLFLSPGPRRPASDSFMCDA